MKTIPILKTGAVVAAFVFVSLSAVAQIGRRWPSEKKMVVDPVTGIHLTFLTSGLDGNSKIYQTHPDWTADGKWVIFRSHRVAGQLFCVNEDSGVIVQVTEHGYVGMPCLSRKEMKLYIMRPVNPPNPSTAPSGRRRRPSGPTEVVEIDLARLFADSAAGTMKPESAYDHVCGVFPAVWHADGNMGLDANEDYIYCRVRGPEVSALLPAGEKPDKDFGPRHMGAGPTGLASMNLKTGAIKHVVTVPFQIGHVQTNPWVPGQIVFCWETGGKSPQRTWTVMADGTGLRPLYKEAPYEWVTHEAVITPNEAAIAIIALRKPGGTRMSAWGPAGTDSHPTGVGIVNIKTGEMRIVGQLPEGDPGRSIWHVNGSSDGRWAVADDFKYRLWIIDRHSGEMRLLASMGEKTTAADHIHPTFNADGTKIEIQSAMISSDNHSLNICIVPVPKSWLARTYPGPEAIVHGSE